MKSIDNPIRVSLAALCLAAPFAANANMIWPSIYIVQQYYVWYVILAGLFIEILAARIFLKTDWWRSTYIMFTANAISALIGFILIPVSGIFVEILLHPFGGGTFHLSHWIIDYIVAALANTLVEGMALKLIFKYPFKPLFWWLFVANLLSIIICVIGAVV